MRRLSTPASGKCSRKQLPDFQNNEALVVRHQGVRLTFSELAAAVERTARGLTGLGLGTKDRIGVWSTNCAEWVQMHLACARIGAVLVNVNPAYRAYELAFVLRRSGMKALFLWEKDKRSDYRAIVDEAVAGQTLALEHVVYFGSEGWSGMLAKGRDIPARRIASDEVTNIQYTSGTTGSPKGVLLTHRNVLNNAVVLVECMRVSHRDRIVVPVPFVSLFRVRDWNHGFSRERGNADTPGCHFRRAFDFTGHS